MAQKENIERPIYILWEFVHGVSRVVATSTNKRAILQIKLNRECKDWPGLGPSTYIIEEHEDAESVLEPKQP